AFRKLLQDESTRVFSQAAAAAKAAPAGWFAAFWPRFAVAAGVLTLFLIAALYRSPKGAAPRLEVAQNVENLAPAPSSASPQPAAVPGTGGDFGGSGGGPAADRSAVKAQPDDGRIMQR